MMIRILFQKMHPSIATLKSIRLVFGRPVRAWPHGVGIPMVQSPEFWGLPWVFFPTWISNTRGYPRKNINTPENVDLHRCSISIFYIYIFIYLLGFHCRWYLIVGYFVPRFWWSTPRFLMAMAMNHLSTVKPATDWYLFRFGVQ